MKVGGGSNRGALSVGGSITRSRKVAAGTEFPILIPISIEFRVEIPRLWKLRRVEVDVWVSLQMTNLKTG